MGSHISIVVCPAQNCGWSLAANGILNNISSGVAQCFKIVPAMNILE